jgi:phage shock protein A
MEDFVKSVRQESDQVADELRKVLEQLEPLVEQRRRLEERARALKTVISTYQPGTEGAPLIGDPGERHFTDVAHDILASEGELYYEDLLTRLNEAGVRVPGRNPGANLIAHMGRDKRFHRVRRGTYAVQP